MANAFHMCSHAKRGPSVTGGPSHIVHTYVALLGLFPVDSVPICLSIHIFSEREKEQREHQLLGVMKNQAPNVAVCVSY